MLAGGEQADSTQNGPNTARLSREQCTCFRSRNNSSRSYSSSQSSTEEHGLRASQQFPLKSLPPPCFPVTMLSLK